MPLALLLLGMTAAVVLTLLLPLLLQWRAPVARRQYDRAVYRAQLAELERDVARGVIGEADARAARLEIERRLLAATTAPATPARIALDAPAPRAGSNRSLAIAVALIIVGGAGLLYLHLGAPGVPDMPFAERNEATPATQAPHTDMADAAKALAARLAADPNNAQGWLLYARAESILGNWQQSADADQHAIALGRNDADTLAAYGEMQVMAANGIVGPPARATFASALQRDAKNNIARYYLALADAQGGDSKGAIAAWQTLAADLPEGSPMREAIGRRVANAAAAAGIPAPALPKGQPPAAPASDAAGPTPAQMAAVENMSPADRTKMVRGMVEKLAARLAVAPDNPNGWLQLGRAYAVLGEQDKAADAYDHATKLKPDDTSIPLQEVEALLTNLKPEDAIPARAVTLLKQIEAATPNQPEVLWYLGVVAVRNGQRDEARRDWQRLLSLLPADGEDHKTVVEALQTLDKS